MVSAQVGAHKAINQKHYAQQKKVIDKTLSNKRRDCCGEHLLHEEASS